MKSKSFASVLTVVGCFMIFMISCSKDFSYNTNSTELDVSTDYDYDFTTPALGKLGRVLFYDQSLSINNSVSCGSCHKQSLAFADNKSFSKGFENFATSRNTPPIQNLGAGMFITLGGGPAFSGQALFWDGRERLLQNMVMQPIFNHVEMGMRDSKKIVTKVASRPYYPALFEQAFGDGDITFNRISEALTGFVSSISANSNAVILSNGPGMSQFENPKIARGSQLFIDKYDCGSCHKLFSPSGYSEPIGDELINIGLDVNYEDNGKGDLTGLAADNGKFKIPNLNNIALTAPYMHDGRFATLEQVLEHYSEGIANHPNLDARLKDDNDEPMKLQITEQDKIDMIAFLNSLTDQQMISDPKFSDPFKKR